MGLYGKRSFKRAPRDFMGTKYPLNCINVLSSNGDTIIGTFNPDNMTVGQKILTISSPYKNVIRNLNVTGCI